MSLDPDTSTEAPWPAVAFIQLVINAEPWVDQAVCAQTDPEIFFPEKGGSCLPAKAICHTCPVTTECLNYALDHGERFGVWGGRSPRDRALMHWTAAA